jgi:catechol 2,3-dioxygenase
MQIPSNTKIHPATRLGYVHLTVSDLGRSLRYYQGSLGMNVHRQEGDTAYLGAGKDNLLALSEMPTARHVPRTTGLYHFALLVPSRLELAKTLRNLVDSGASVDGASDHLVSEALYLSDPDGNGIEIYRDRPRETWQLDQGQIRMAVDPLDFGGLMAELEGQPESWEGLHPDTVLGHMHLHVADLKAAEDFYTRGIGFDLMLNYGGSAAFLSAGGYHHHLGINTWNGVGASPPPEGAVGLRYFVIRVPDDSELTALSERLLGAGFSYQTREAGIFVRDPSLNGVMIAVG